MSASNSSGELPDGFYWEYREGDDGGGNISFGAGKSTVECWPSTRYRRAVGPWEVDRPGGRPMTPAEVAARYWNTETMPRTMERLK